MDNLYFGTTKPTEGYGWFGYNFEDLKRKLENLSTPEGIEGDSAYDIATHYGYINGGVSDWLDTLQGVDYEPADSGTLVGTKFVDVKNTEDFFTADTTVNLMSNFIPTPNKLFTPMVQFSGGTAYLIHNRDLTKGQLILGLETCPIDVYPTQDTINVFETSTTTPTISYDSPYYKSCYINIDMPSNTPGYKSSGSFSNLIERTENVKIVSEDVYGSKVRLTNNTFDLNSADLACLVIKNSDGTFKYGSKLYLHFISVVCNRLYSGGGNGSSNSGLDAKTFHNNRPFSKYVSTFYVEQPKYMSSLVDFKIKGVLNG